MDLIHTASECEERLIQLIDIHGGEYTHLPKTTKCLISQELGNCWPSLGNRLRY